MIVKTRVTLCLPNDEELAVDAWGDFIDGSLDDWNTDEPTELTEKQSEKIVEGLYDAYNS